MIFLFGDYHFSREEICEPCTCIDDSCCYQLSDPIFLKLLDSLVLTEDHPIDFYTETFLVGTGQGFEGGIMNDFTTGEMMTCYHHLFRGTEHDRCPTKKIRWHGGDPRLAGKLSNLDDPVFYKILSTTEPRIYKKYLSEKSDLFDTLDILDIFGKEPIERQIYFLMTNAIISPSVFLKMVKFSVFKDIKTFKKFLLNLLHTDIEIFTEELFSLMTKNKSVIYKQFLKQDYKLFTSIDYWKGVYVDIVKRMLTEEDLIFYDRSINSINNLQKYIDEHLTHTEIKNLIKNFDSICRIITVPFLDIYTLTRIFKQPIDGYRSTLSFCYFGNEHINNIKDTLLYSGLYELIYELPVVDDNRCKKFDINLNLSKEVILHNKNIDICRSKK